MRILLGSSGGLMVFIWLLITVASVISSVAKKKGMMKNGNWPNNHPQPGNNWPNHQSPFENPGNWPNSNMPRSTQNRMPQPEQNAAPMAGSAPMQRAEWDNAKIRQQMSRFQGNSGVKPRTVPSNQVNTSGLTGAYSEEESYRREEDFQRQSDLFTQPIPVERVEEYVPEEFGEAGSSADDTFYSSAAIQSSLHDEEDIAREKAYQTGHKDAFKQQINKKSRFSSLLAGNHSIKKAILLSEILAEPKALKESTISF